MASIFCCCWSKKGSGQIKQTESKSVQEEKVPNKAASPAAAGIKCEDEEDNEILSSCTDDLDNEMKQPLLSSLVLQDSNDEAGDFSVVQRETEILRSYRKPAPPKRARQSRVPRALKTKSQDIFTELNEDENDQNSDKENAGPNRNTDIVLLREGKETTRDVQSSMLTEIEQTLAALHTIEESTATVKTTNSENKSRINKPTVNGVDKIITERKPDAETINNDGSDNMSKTSQVLSFSEKQTESTPEKESSKMSPISKPKKGLKVSPKPSPKTRSKMKHSDDNNTASTTPEDASEMADNNSTYAKESTDNDNTVEVNSSQPQDIQSQVVGTGEGLDQVMSPSVSSASNTNETRYDSPPSGDTNISDKNNHDKNTNSSTTVGPCDKAADDVTTEETDNNREHEDAETQVQNNVKNTKEESPSDNQKKSDGITLASDDQKTVDLTFNQQIQNDKSKSTMADSKNQQVGSTQHSTVNSEIPVRQRVGIRRGRSEETGRQHKESSLEKQRRVSEKQRRESSEKQQLESSEKQQRESSDKQQRESSEKQHREPTEKQRRESTEKQHRESSEDQTGKGKTSKIPVRAGSKARSISPKMVSGDKNLNKEDMNSRL